MEPKCASQVLVFILALLVDLDSLQTLHSLSRSHSHRGELGLVFLVAWNIVVHACLLCCIVLDFFWIFFFFNSE